jgi:uncharacterized protein (TIRG00374 family)
VGWANRPRWVSPVLNVTVSLVLGVLFTWLAMREVDFSKVGDYLQTVEYVYLVPYLGLLLVIHVLRVWRWGMLLSPVAHVPFGRLLPVASVGFLAVMLLPFRMGEFVRPYLVTERGKITFSAALGTCVVERVIDGLLVCGLLFATLAFIDLPIPAGVITSGYVASAFFGGVLVVLVIALWKRDASIRFWKKVLGVISHKLADALTGMLAAFIDGLRALPDFRRIAGILVLSLVYWALAALGIWVLFRAFHLDLPMSAAIVLNGILVIGIMVPGGPGFAGPFEVAVKVALVDLFLVSDTVNAGFTIVLHGFQFAFTLGVGVIFLFSTHVSFVKLIGASGKAAERLKAEGS